MSQNQPYGHFSERSARFTTLDFEGIMMLDEKMTEKEGSKQAKG